MYFQRDITSLRGYIRHTDTITLPEQMDIELMMPMSCIFLSRRYAIFHWDITTIHCQLFTLIAAYHAAEGRRHIFSWAAIAATFFAAADAGWMVIFWFSSQPRHEGRRRHHFHRAVTVRHDTTRQIRRYSRNIYLYALMVVTEWYFCREMIDENIFFSERREYEICLIDYI